MWLRACDKICRNVSGKHTKLLLIVVVKTAFNIGSELSISVYMTLNKQGLD